PMSIVFRCGCGKRLQVKDQAAGKTCVCPGCEKKVRIPLASAEDITTNPAKPSPAAQRKVVAKASPKAPVPDDEDDEEEERPIRKLRKRRSRAAERVLWPWITAGAAVLAIGVGITLWLTLRKPKEDKVATQPEDKKPKDDPKPADDPN